MMRKGREKGHNPRTIAKRINDSTTASKKGLKYSTNQIAAKLRWL